MKAPSDTRYAAIYARVSTEDQVKGYSIPTQLEACQKLADREGYTAPETHVLVDEGISGTTLERPGLRKLRELIQTQAIAAVIVIDPDRLSRNLGHQLLLAEEMERGRVKLLIVSHPLEQGPEGWMFFQMRGALAEYERAKLLERTKRGMLGRARAGYPGGGQVPLGYRAIREPHKTRWEVDTDEATVVHRIFALCIRGLSVQDIARQLTQAGVFTRVDRRQDNGGRKERAPGVWEPKSVYNILTNGGYTGTVYYGKWEAVTRTTRRLRPQEEWIGIAVPAILDRATFDKAQAQLARNKRLSRRNRKHEYLLIGGRFRCGRCGRTMSGYASHDRRRYRCASVYVCDRDEGCRGAPLAEDVEGQVWRAVEAVLRQPEVISTEVQRQQAHAEDQRVTIQDACDLLDKSLGKCDREEQRWANAYAAEVISLEELKGYRAEIATRRRSVLAQRAERHAQLNAMRETVGQVEALTDYCTRVRQQLQSFAMMEKRLALEALDIQVTWIRGQPLVIQGSIPMGDIVSIQSRSYTRPPQGPPHRAVSHARPPRPSGCPFVDHALSVTGAGSRTA